MYKNHCRVAAFCFSASVTPSHADTAQVLPPGNHHLRYQVMTGGADERFDAGGERQSVAAFNQASLTSAGLPMSVATLYRIAPGGELSFTRHDLYWEYGITDSVSLGLWTYYADQSYQRAGGLTRGVGWGSLPASQQALIEGAATTASAAAIGDTVVGLKRRVLGENDSPARAAVGVGVRLPTGHVADPRDAGDLSIGDGQYDVGIWTYFDWEPSERWLINLHTRHEYQLADERDALVPTDPTRVLSREFQPGFYHYAEMWARYRIPRGSHDWSLELKGIYERQDALETQAYDPASGRFAGGLVPVADSNSNLLRLEPQIQLSLFPRKVPLTITLLGGIPISGRNAFATEYIGVRFDAYW